MSSSSVLCLLHALSTLIPFNVLQPPECHAISRISGEVNLFTADQVRACYGAT